MAVGIVPSLVPQHDAQAGLTQLNGKQADPSCEMLKTLPS